MQLFVCKILHDSYIYTNSFTLKAQTLQNFTFAEILQKLCSMIINIDFSD